MIVMIESINLLNKTLHTKDRIVATFAICAYVGCYFVFMAVADYRTAANN
jgi:uncharacterized membrane protein YqhA